MTYSYQLNNNTSTINVQNATNIDRLGLGLNNINNLNNQNISQNNSSNNNVQNYSYQRNSQEKRYSRLREILIISGLLILGILVQPVYLVFKFIELLLECYRRFGCWFYYGSF